MERTRTDADALRSPRSSPRSMPSQLPRDGVPAQRAEDSVPLLFNDLEPL
jgi:hypothetical protein